MKHKEFTIIAKQYEGPDLDPEDILDALNHGRVHLCLEIVSVAETRPAKRKIFERIPRSRVRPIA